MFQTVYFKHNQQIVEKFSMINEAHMVAMRRVMSFVPAPRDTDYK
jgi:hypothetical protein